MVETTIQKMQIEVVNFMNLPSEMFTIEERAKFELTL